MLTDLKRCPFCGESKAYYTHNLDMGPDGITCPVCHIIVRFPRARCKAGERFEAAMNRMAEIWNMREGSHETD